MSDVITYEWKQYKHNVHVVMFYVRNDKMTIITSAKYHTQVRSPQ